MKKLLSCLVSAAVLAMPLASFTAPAAAAQSVVKAQDKKETAGKKTKAKKGAKKKMAKKAS
jgi:Ni/Co efflux regulator RcnB